MIITITKECNNNCKFCYISDEYHQKSLDRKFIGLKEIESRIIIAKKNGIKLINFFGGEPTIHPNFFQFVELLEKNKIGLNLSSNLRIFYYDNFVKKLLTHSNICFIQTTLLSNNPEEHDNLTRSKGSWTQTVSGIRNLLKYGFNPKNILINIVMTSVNLKSLSNTIKFIFNDLNKSIKIKLSFVSPEGNALLNPYIVPRFSDLKPYILDAVNLAENLGINELFIEKGPICFCPNNKIISYNYESVLMESCRHIKPEICSDCSQKKCVGIHKNYVKLYGKTELSPTDIKLHIC